MNAMTEVTTAGETRQADPVRQMEFEERMVGALNEAALMLMLSLGHRSGLLDALAAAGPVDSVGLAEAAGLQERYVREWLGAMTVAHVVELDAGSGRYRLPAEHAALLTRTGDANLAAMAQYIPLLGAVEDDVLACFRDGGGVPYHRYGRFHEVMAEDSGQTVLPALTDHILPLVPGLTDRLRAGIEVLDIGCGRGLALMQMAAAFPDSAFTGLDLSADAISWAQAEALRRDLHNLRFEIRDLRDFDVTAPEAEFDLVTTFDAIHDQARPLAMLRGIRRALAPDGVYLAQDVNGSGHHHGDRDHPLGTLLYTVSCMHCMSVSLAQGGEGLGAMWGREMAQRHFREAGFGQVETHELPHDSQNAYYVCRP
ncbi:class I SAM-dependent methyltransferase [Marinibaculum pumilum]|uniref:Class I SAM-dependent methyltransferase n=1 Tax=Marinibaculum pumilum TaxID=1766165 RepID=A0ABV7KZV2_9PROT